MLVRIMPDFVLLQIIFNNIQQLQQKSSDFNHVAMWNYGPKIVPYKYIGELKVISICCVK